MQTQSDDRAASQGADIQPANAQPPQFVFELLEAQFFQAELASPKARNQVQKPNYLGLNNSVDAAKLVMLFREAGLYFWG